MYKVITFYSRPVSSIPYYSSSSPAAKAKVDQFNSLETAAAGWVSTARESTETSVTVTHTWASEAQFKAFTSANAAFLAELAAERDAYQEAHGITRVVEVQTA